MVRLIFAVVVLLLLVFWAIYKMRKSRWFNNMCNSMETGYEDTPNSKEAIKNITKAETELGKQADKNTKEAERLNKESSAATGYLKDRGVHTEKEGSK